tara:strand:+ start:476 stop:634 length:159 start_codon:yes stop_codon:yes gene_type:complete
MQLNPVNLNQVNQFLMQEVMEHQEQEIQDRTLVVVEVVEQQQLDNHLVQQFL